MRSSLLGLGEAAAYLGMSRRTFYRRVYGRIRVFRVGGIIRVPQDELDEFVQRHLQAHGPRKK